MLRVKALLLAPAYLHVIVATAVSVVLGLLLNSQVLDDLRRQSERLENEHNRITQQLDEYQNHRQRINTSISKVSDVNRQLEKVNRLMSETSGHHIESRLTGFAVANGLKPLQIDQSYRISDEHGEFTRISMKLYGDARKLQEFLQYSLSKRHLLIWEKLIMHTHENSVELSMEISLKHYSSLNNAP